MREKVFKAKRKNWKELPKEKWWVKGSLLEKDGNSYIITDVNVTEWEDDSEMEACVMGCLVESDTICEFTGVTDNDNNMIFENDIVRDLGIYLVHKSYAEKGLPGEENYEKYRESAKLGVVLFCTENVGSCGCCFPRFEGSGFKADDIALEESEVIGNIFDNPELI